MPRANTKTTRAARSMESKKKKMKNPFVGHVFLAIPVMSCSSPAHELKRRRFDGRQVSSKPVISVLNFRWFGLKVTTRSPEYSNLLPGV